MARIIANMYQCSVAIIQNTLQAIDYLALMTDCWSDKYNMRSYMGLSAHYVFDGKVENLTLGIIQFKTEHTSLALSSKIETLLDFWKIDKMKMTAVVSDGAHNISRAIRNTFGAEKYLWCYAHQINLIIQDAFKSSPGLLEIIDKVKAIVTHFKQSNRASNILRQELEKASMNPSLRLKQECITRWNSKYK